MNTHIKTFLLFIFLLIVLTPIFSMTADARNLKDAFLTDNDLTDDPLDTAAKSAGYDVSKKDDNLKPIFETIINIGLSILGVVFMLLLIYGGILWMTDQGNEEQVKKAKDLIIAAFIGLAIVVSAYAISWFIINLLSQKTLNN